MSENAASSRRSATRSLVLCALMAALTAICSQIQIPLPMIPINLALFAVHLSGAPYFQPSSAPLTCTENTARVIGLIGRGICI